MLEQGYGHLLVTSSVAGKHAVPYHTTYCAAKHALHGWFDTLRIEHLSDDIAVTLLVIAGVRSHVFERALTGDGSEYGRSDWSDDAGMTAEACADRVVEAIVRREPEVVISIEEAKQALETGDEPVEAVAEKKPAPKAEVEKAGSAKAESKTSKKSADAA